MSFRAWSQLEMVYCLLGSRHLNTQKILRGSMIILLSALVGLLSGGAVPEEDVFKTSAGELRITHVVHGTLMLQVGETVIHVDPFSRGDYSNLPKADLVLITHHHGDHLDPDALKLVVKESTIIIATAEAAKKLADPIVMANGDTHEHAGIDIEAVPAYNIKRGRAPGEPYHPKGVGNGYVLTIGDTRVYIGGDTEVIPEMGNLKDIEIAFIPCNLPFTMTPEELAEAARMIKPKVLYAYHTGNTPAYQIRNAMKGVRGVELRILKKSR